MDKKDFRIKDVEDNTHDEVGLRLLHGGKVDDHDAVDHHHAAHHAVKANNLISDHRLCYS